MALGECNVYIAIDNSVEPRHAVFTSKAGGVSIAPVAEAGTLVNGRPLTGSVELRHLDRILFGEGAPPPSPLPLLF